MTTPKDKKLEVNPELCFVCQEAKPEYRITTFDIFETCKSCMEAIVTANDSRNRIKKALIANDNLGIFQKTLGMSPHPNKVKVEKL
jgi:hypothetical protein